jgi:uncharacterized protein YbjT (DUF2867 family)
MTTNTSEKRIIAVVGATGHQGGGLVRAIAADPDGGYVARAITRDPNTPRARALADLGVEVRAADLDDPASVDEAFGGAYGAYCVTFLQEHFDPEREIRQAHTMAAAAQRNELKHVIWSTQEDTRDYVPLDDNRMPTLQGRFKVPHFDAKAEADAAFHAAGVPVTFLRTAFYWENLFTSGGPQRGDDGRLALTMPLGKAKLPGIAAGDIGRVAYAILRRPGLAGQTLSISGENLTGEQIAAGLAEALGEPVDYQDIPPEVFRGLGFPGAADLGNMFQFSQEFEDVYAGQRDPAASRRLVPELQTFQQWLESRSA